MKYQLSQLLTKKGEFQPQVKEQTTKEFCEYIDRENWFLKLAMPMLVAAMIELVESTHDVNPYAVLPKVAKSCYKEDATCPEFP